MGKRELGLLAAGVAAGLLIAYVDSRPSWDDAGITALALLVTAAVIASLAGRRAWLSALAVGVWVPVFGIALAGNVGSLLALLFAFAGAYAGAAARRVVTAH